MNGLGLAVSAPSITGIVSAMSTLQFSMQMCRGQGGASSVKGLQAEEVRGQINNM